MSSKGIVILLLAIIFCFCMAKLSIKKRKPSEKGVMRHGEYMLYFAWFSFLMGFFPIISYFTEPPADIWLGLLFITPFGFWGFFYLLSAKYIFTEKYFERTSWVTPSDVYLWRSLLFVEYDDGRGGDNKRVSGYVLKFPHKDIVVPEGVENEDSFLTFLEQKGFTIQGLKR